MNYWTDKILLESLIQKNIIKLDRGRVISSIDLANIIGDFPVYSSSAKGNGLFGKYGLFDFDEELITWSVDGGGYFFYRPKHKFSVTNVSGILRILDNKKYNYKFLYYLLAYQHSTKFFDYVDKAHPSVIKKRYNIPILEITEQQKIAEILSKVDQAIEQTQQLIAKYQRIKTGLMQDLLTKGIDENGNIRSEETHKFKDSPLGRIPVEWTVEKLGNLITAIDPQPDYRTPPAVIDGIPYIGISDIKKNQIDFEKSRKVGFNVLEKQTQSFTINAGDIIFGKIGTIGKPTILPDFNITKYTLSANVILIKPNECPNFIFFTLTSKYIQNQISLAIHSTSQPAFGMQKIRELSIITPPLEERNRIINGLKSINDFFVKENDKLNKLKSIKTALMQDILSGKKRVTSLLKEETDDT